MRRFRLENAWRTVLRDLGVSVDRVLRRADLPPGLLTLADPIVDVDQYYRLWAALTAEADNPDLGLHLGQALNIEDFDPALFAAACSPNMLAAVRRLARYKRLFGPFALDVQESAHQLSIRFFCVDRPDVPRQLGLAEQVFQVRWIRNSTRHPVQPLRVSMPEPPTNPAFGAYFGVRPCVDSEYTVVFSRVDAERPFLTRNPRYWQSLEPVLSRRLSDLDADTSTTERLRAALMELLPAGQSTRADAAKMLGMGERTLQRRLGTEATTYTAVLAKVREQLAQHYLTTTDIPVSEISFLLGYDDPNSFFRAFKRWTALTPDEARTRRA
jgi:AraC-like DNA-binding protein